MNFHRYITIHYTLSNVDIANTLPVDLTSKWHSTNV